MSFKYSVSTIVLSISIVCFAPVTAVNAESWTSESHHSVQGVTIYDPDELTTFAAQLSFDREGEITALGIADIVEQIYREDGYFLAEARVAADGRTIVVSEGYLESVNIEGVDEKKFEAVRGIFQPLVGVRPLTLKSFERSVMLAEDIPDLDVSAELDFQNRDGARLRVLGEQLRKQSGSATLDNPPRELGNALSLYLIQEFYSSFLVGDLLRIEGSGTYNWDEDDTRSLWGALTYRAPLASNGLFGEVYVGNVAARRDISGQFARTDFDGKNAAVALGFPFQRDVDSYGYGLLEFRYSESDSISGGVDLSSTANVLAASYVYGRTFSDGGALEAGASLSFGNSDNDTNGSAVDDGDSSFWHLRAGLGYEAPLPALSENTAWRTEIWGQYSSNRLPSVEEMFLGDRYGLRGYRFDEVDGDSGITAIIEVSHSFAPQNETVKRVSPFAFLDTGYVSNNDPASFEVNDQFLASTGIGVDVAFAKNLYVTGYIGVPLRDGPLTDAGNPGAYLSLTTAW
jgi:hemolysin activation/secretion protein